MKFSKLVSLLLVPLLLITLALPVYADGNDQSYLIYFETGGGTGVPIIASTNLEGRLTSLPSPTMDGYTFEGWYTDELDGDRVTTSTEFTSDGTIYAHWRPISKKNTSSSSGTSASKPDSSAAAETDESFSFKSHAGTFLVAGTMLFTLMALYAR